MATATAAPGPIHNKLTPVPPYQEAHSGLPSLDSDTHDRTHLHASAAPNGFIPRGTVTAEMNFYDPPKDGSPPHNFVEIPTDGTPQRNFGALAKDIKINDLRGKEAAFDLDQHAFKALQNFPRHNSIDWDNDDAVKRDYYPEVEQILLNNIPGNPYKVLIFDHTVRRADPEAKRAPVTRVHIDQTAKSARQRVEFHLSEEEAKQVLDNNTRYRIINVWRPINGAVEAFPLAFANSATVPDSDMVGVEHRYPNRTGETAAVKYNKDHEWYYWSGMDDDERLLLQCADSADFSIRVPHSAFPHPGSLETAKGRESIEVRALVFG